MIDLNEVLNWVNSQREELGLEALTELRKGMVGMACECPIARSLRPSGKIAATTQHGTNIYEGSAALDPEVSIEHPDYVVQFVFAFDDGQIPELVTTR